jgi:glutaredoxin
MTTTRVPGKNKQRRVFVYALSTCGWCRKAKEMLEQRDVEYEYVFVDQLTGDDRNAAMDAVRAINPRGSFPTIKVDEEIVIGFDEERLAELLGV